MKTYVIVLLCTLMIAGTSCQKEQDDFLSTGKNSLKTVPELQSTDSLMTQWNTFFNTQDAAGLYSRLTDNVVVRVNGSTYTGSEESYNDFFLFAINYVDNMTSVKSQENINSQVCWQKGTFSHDVLDPYGNVVFVSTGDYDIKWKKQDDDTWKIFHADYY